MAPRHWPQDGSTKTDGRWRYFWDEPKRILRESERPNKHVTDQLKQHKATHQLVNRLLSCNPHMASTLEKQFWAPSKPGPTMETGPSRIKQKPQDRLRWPDHYSEILNWDSKLLMVVTREVQDSFKKYPWGPKQASKKHPKNLATGNICSFIAFVWHPSRKWESQRHSHLKLTENCQQQRPIVVTWPTSSLKLRRANDQKPKPQFSSPSSQSLPCFTRSTLT
jgi:hypothetical protein